MSTRRWPFALGLVVLLAAPLAARAQDANTEAAQIHYKAGEQYYVRGLYGQAIAEFREAYRLSQAPALLYNMSQAYERAGDLPAAREHLSRYIGSGDADAAELPSLREKLASLDRRIAASGAPPRPPVAEAPPPTAPAPPPAVAAPAPIVDVVDAAPRRPFKTWKWIAGGTGGGFLVLSALFALDAKKQEQDLEDAAKQPRPSWDDYAETYDRGKRSNALAIGLGVAGVALAATGVVLFVLDAKSKESPRAALLPLAAPGGAGAAAIVRF
jgi:tetratricopeptide (TPR) repeat protein